MNYSESKKELFFNGEQLTIDSLNKTVEYFIKVNQEIIEGAKNGDFFVNDLDSLIDWKQETIYKLKSGEFKVSMTFLQRAYYIQTGKSVALLPQN